MKENYSDPETPFNFPRLLIICFFSLPLTYTRHTDKTELDTLLVGCEEEDALAGHLPLDVRYEGLAVPQHLSKPHLKQTREVNPPEELVINILELIYVSFPLNGVGARV